MAGVTGGVSSGGGAAKRGRPLLNHHPLASSASTSLGLLHHQQQQQQQVDSGGASMASAAQPSLVSMMGPTLQVHNSFADQNSKRIVMALQSGLKSELIWALNTLALLSFKEKDDPRKDATPLAKIPGVLDALLNVINAKWANGLATDETGTDKEGQRKSIDWWCDEEGLFNLDEEGRAERQQCAVAASNIIRNFSFMPENEMYMAQHYHCLETIIQCMEDHSTEDEELVTNALETIVNLAPYFSLRAFSNKTSEPQNHMTEKRAVEAIMQMLESPVKAWHCSAAELLGRLVVNPDNEPFLLPFTPQVYKRLVDLLSLPGADAQAAAVAALYNFAEVNVDCRLRLANERWAIGRLVRIIQAPHPLSEVCRKAALTLESLASEPQNRTILLAYEHTFAELAFSDARLSDIFARVLWELSSSSSSKVATARGVWGA